MQALQGDHPTAGLWTSLPSRFVGIVGARLVLARPGSPALVIIPSAQFNETRLLQPLAYHSDSLTHRAQLGCRYRATHITQAAVGHHQ